MSRKTLFKAALAAVAAAVLGGSTPAQAEFFEFSTSVTIDPVGTTPGIPPGSISSGTVPIVNGSFTQVAPYSQFNSGAGNDTRMIALMSDPSDAGHENASGSGTNIVYGQVDASSAGTSAAPQVIAFNFTYSLTLSDYSAPTGGVLTGTGVIQLSGRVSGTMGLGQVNLQYYNFSIVPADGQLTIPGIGSYTVTLNPSTPPGLSNNGTLGAHVAIREVPEPASLALLGLGGLGALAVCRRRGAAA